MTNTYRAVAEWLKMVKDAEHRIKGSPIPFLQDIVLVAAGERMKILELRVAEYARAEELRLSKEMDSVSQAVLLLKQINKEANEL